MRILVQRSKESSVLVDNVTVGHITKGLVLFVGFTHNDNIDTIKKMVTKVLNLRIFDDENGIMNKNVKDIGGSILSISQFTLYANTKKGNRPSYVEALNSKDAEILYNLFNELLKKEISTETGIFKADMQVLIHNDGPITIALET